MQKHKDHCLPMACKFQAAHQNAGFGVLNGTREREEIG